MPPVIEQRRAGRVENFREYLILRRAMDQAEMFWQLPGVGICGPGAFVPERRAANGP